MLWHAAVCDGCPRAQAALVAAYERLVHQHAHRYAGRGVDHADLFQEGLAGFWHACTRFDPARGRISTYATWWIRQRMSRALKNAGTIRLPAHVHDKLRRGELDRGALPRVTASLDQPVGNGDDGRPRALGDLVGSASVDGVDPLDLLLLDEQNTTE